MLVGQEEAVNCQIPGQTKSTKRFLADSQLLGFGYEMKGFDHGAWAQFGYQSFQSVHLLH